MGGRGRRVAVGVGVALACWGLASLVVGSVRLDHALHRVRTDAYELRAALLSGDPAREHSAVLRLQRDATDAQHAAHGLWWSGVGRVPVLGDTVRTESGVAAAVHQVAFGVVPPLVQGWDAALASHDGPAQAADALRPYVDKARSSLAAARDDLRDLPTGAVLPVVSSARVKLTAATDGVASVLGLLSDGTRELPGMVGQDGTRRYFVAFQNDAESRGTGGLVGAYAILRFDRHGMRVEKVGSDRDLEGLPSPQVDLGPDFARLWGRDTRAWQNANLSPHFPYAAQLWLDMWQRRTGERLDGALAVDPTVLAAVLDETGPVTVDGLSVYASDVVPLTESRVYATYQGEESARKDFLVSLARVVLGKLSGPASPSPASLARVLLAQARDRRFLVYSSHPAEQAWLARTPLGGGVPDAPGPFAFAVVDNSAGNKIDYYLDRKVSYDLDACHGGIRTSTITVTLRIDLPTTRLPGIVVQRLDVPPGSRPTGSTSLLVSVFVAQGAALSSATLDGVRTAVVPGFEREHPVFVEKVELLPRVARTLVLHLREPASLAQPVVPVQPLVRSQSTDVRPAQCD